MEKYGIKKEVLHEELRVREAELMRKIQALLSNPEKIASEKTGVELELQQVRSKLTELDLKTE
ncbi:MAG: hypothetical protein EBZ49_00605 [Proteobacteria bacterium]|nr:hypothetical protein [Pseudomonadota bacterium]